MKNKIDYIQIYGERNSGTNYMQALLEENMIQKVDIGPRFGWKHGFTHRKQIAKEDTSAVLFLVITKDPYSWLLSMNKRPHHAPQLYNLPFSEFIRKEWVSYKGKGYNKRAKMLDKKPLQDDEEMMHERHPKTGKRFESVIHLRNAKNERYLGLPELVENLHFVRYIDILEDYKKALSEIQEKNGILLKNELVNIGGHFGKNPRKNFSNQKYYLEKEYLEKIPAEDFRYINTILNENSEISLGYDLYRPV